jgi:hypothetical protein
MSETLCHPGAVEFGAEDCTKFLAFLNPDGIDPTQLSWFTACLSQYYDLTWNKGVWIPGNCRRIFEVEEELKASFAPASCEMKRFARDHYWWEIESIGNNCNLIVDTAGLPPEDQIFKVFRPREYSPYFGLPEFSQGAHLRMYSESQPMDSIGTTMPLFYNFR